MRRRTKLQRLQQMPEPGHLFLLQFQDLTEDVFLQGRVMDSNGSAADFHAVQDEIVVLSPDLRTTEGMRTV